MRKLSESAVDKDLDPSAGDGARLPGMFGKDKEWRQKSVRNLFTPQVQKISRQLKKAILQQKSEELEPNNADGAIYKGIWKDKEWRKPTPTKDDIASSFKQMSQQLRDMLANP